MGTGGSKTKKGQEGDPQSPGRKKSNSSNSSSNSSKHGKSKAKKLSIEGSNRNELIDPILEYINTNKIDLISYDFASRLKATEINLQWAIANGTCSYAKSKRDIKLQPIKNRRGWRNVRIYVASTFDDFKQERNLLIEEVCVILMCMSLLNKNH